MTPAEQIRQAQEKMEADVETIIRKFIDNTGVFVESIHMDYLDIGSLSRPDEVEILGIQTQLKITNQ